MIAQRASTSFGDVADPACFFKNNHVMSSTSRFVGVHLKNIKHLFTSDFQKLDKREKNMAVNLIQAVAGGCIMAGGIGMAATAGPWIAAGAVATGLMNMSRNLYQYGQMAKAQDPEEVSKAGAKGSFLSALTNSPQALALSLGNLPAMAAVAAYLGKSMIDHRDALDHGQQKESAAKAGPDVGKETGTEFFKKPVRNTISKIIGFSGKALGRVANATVDNTIARGFLKSKFGGGFMRKAPSVVLGARAGAQMALGTILANPELAAAGVFLIAGSYAMYKADNMGPGHLKVNNSQADDEEAEQFSVGGSQIAPA